MRKVITFLVVTALALLASVGFSQEHDGDADLALAIDALIASYTEGWNAGDASACAATYTENGVSVDLFGSTFTGRTAIEESIAQTLETYSGSTIDIVRTSLHHVNDSLVVADGTWKVNGSTAEGVPTEGFYTVIATKSGDDWLISHGQAKVAPPMTE